MTGLRIALSLFTVLPMRPVAVERRNAQRAVPWLPAVGVLLGILASAAAPLAWHGHTRGCPTLGAILAVLALAVLTRGLHLDRLADLADGLGSGQPAADALRIMRASDIGPFGVATIMLALLVQVLSLAAILTAVTLPLGVVSVTVAVVTGRVAVILAAARGVPAARPEGFGALIADSVGKLGRATTLAGTVIISDLGAAGAGATRAEVVWLTCAVLGALALSSAVRTHAVARLGGVTGDVFGGLVEIATGTCLLVVALGEMWSP